MKRAAQSMYSADSVYRISINILTKNHFRHEPFARLDAEAVGPVISPPSFVGPVRCHHTHAFGVFLLCPTGRLFLLVMGVCVSLRGTH